MDHLERSTKW